jgi:AraC family transcriptional regulator
MESVQKALWFMESRFRDDVSLDELSAVAGISRYHFAHVFARAIGQSAMRYMRGRRLSEAARVLANGGPDILSVALDFGYGSHEAFTRAFRDQFGLTPESVRAQHHLDNVNLVEAIKMDDPITTLAPPRIEQGGLLLIAGLSGKYSLDTHQNIPALWQRFQPHLGNVPGQVFAAGRRLKGGGRLASVTTWTIMETSTISPASRCPDSPDCPPNLRDCAFQPSATPYLLIANTFRPSIASA